MASERSRRRKIREISRLLTNAVWRQRDSRRHETRRDAAVRALEVERLEDRTLLSSGSIGPRILNYQDLPPQSRIVDPGFYLTGTQAGDPLDIAMSYLRTNAAQIGLSPSDLDSATVSSMYTTAHNGVTQIHLDQNVNGLEIYTADININITSDGRVINVGSTFLPNVETTAPAATPGIDAIPALESLVAELGWSFESTPGTVKAPTGTNQQSTLSASGISLEDIPAKLQYVYTDGALELAWDFSIQTLDGEAWYQASVNANTAEPVHITDWVAHASYRAFEYPIENPDDGPQTVIVDPQNLTASPFGWHDTDGIAGAEFTDTRGNNVFAQEDTDANNTGGTRPDGGAALDFNIMFDPAQGAAANQNAAIVNLFYSNNVIHDVFYHYGFDEVSGNFQENNYGNGGIGGDAVRADALDGSGTNNANFATPPDGIPGRMQMYEFTLTNPTRDSDMSNVIITHEFGHGISNRLAGGPANSGALSVFQARSMGEGWSDFFGLMLTQKTTDMQFDAYPVGNYVLGNPLNDPNGGIRDFPYSFNMAISPKTYRYVPIDFPSVHSAGEIMAATMWDLNWLLINGDGGNIPAMGFDPDLYNGTGGNNLVLQLAIDGLKLMPANPSMLDFRDAVVQADLANNGGANLFAIWTAFARRGMGYSAFDGGSGSSINVMEAFDLPPGLIFQVEIQQDSIREDAGVAAATAVVKRSQFLNTLNPLVVTLTNGDPSEISIPAMVTIPAGQIQTTFLIDAVDDMLLDGTQTVAITATAPGLLPWTDTIDVLDVESLTVDIAATSIREDAGANATTATLTRSNTDTAPPGILLTIGNEVHRYDLNGMFVSSDPIDHPNGTRPAGEDARDLIVTGSANVAVYNGTDDATLSIYNPATMTWTHLPSPGLSTDGTLPTGGGIATYKNYIFVTDMNTASGPQDGLLRFNTFTGAVDRFGTTVPGDRLFATGNGIGTTFGDDLVEIDPLTGAVLAEFTPPALQGVRDGLAYDGKSLWFIGSEVNTDLLHEVDPDTGAVISTYNVGRNTGFDGLAVLNGLVYLLDSFLENDIVVFDPASNSIVTTLDIDGLNGGINLGGGLAAARDPNALYVTDNFSQTIYAIDPITGLISNSWDQDLGGGDLGLAVINNEVYVSTNTSDKISVHDRTTGARVRTITVPGSIGFQSLGGDDIPGQVASPYQMSDGVMGLDNLFYALDKAGLVIVAFDPDTLQPLRSLSLSEPVSAIGVTPSGDIFGVNAAGDLIHFDAQGGFVDRVNTGVTDLIDLDIALGGTILIGSTSGEVVVTNIALTAPTSFMAGSTPVYVSFSSAPGQATGDLTVTLTNSDPSEISIPMVVTIPAGQETVTFSIDAVDDFMLDGTQTAMVTPFAAGYRDLFKDSVDVLDAETVAIDVVKSQIAENAGASASLISLTRSDKDGPFPHRETQVFPYLGTTPATIFDNDTTIFPIQVSSQYSFVTDVNVTITAEHPFLSDLDIYLISPAGTRVELMTDIVSNGGGLTNTIFDDEARTSIRHAGTPFTGSFRPEGFLGDFDSENPTGTWILEITDDNPVDVGRLMSWTLTVATRGLEQMPVVLDSNDFSEAGFSGAASTIVMMPANQLMAIFTLDAIDDTILDGPQPVAITATPSFAGFFPTSDTVVVTDYETLSLSVTPSEFSEAGGPGSAIGTITRNNTDHLLPLTVNLMSSDTSEATVLATVDILSGDASATFEIDAVDDTIVDLTQVVTITASAPGYINSPTANVSVSDLEPILEVTTSVLEISENGVSMSATITRKFATDNSTELSVTLSSLDTSELIIQAGVVIPIGVDSVTVPVTVQDDSLLDGPQLVTLMASATGFGDGTAVVQVNDYETLTLSIDKPSFLENAGDDAATGTVTRSNTDNGGALVVTLSSSDTSEATVPATVTIPAGQSSATFKVSAVDDPVVDGTQSSTITASVTGYVGGTLAVEIEDHEPPVVTGPAPVVLVSNPEISWDAIPGATRYDLWVSNVSTNTGQVIREPELTGTTFTPIAPLAIGLYRIWVRAYDAVEQAGFWSRSRDFYVATPPVLTSPTPSGIVAKPEFPQFTWTSVVDAARYDIWVSNLSTNQAQVIRNRNVVNTTFTAPDGMPSGKYRAWVAAINSTGQSGEWSKPVTFTVLEVPEITGPVGSTFNVLPTFEWTAVENTHHYDLWVTNTTLGQRIFRDAFVTETSYVPSADLPNGDYAAWVRAVTADGTTSQWSVLHKFSIGGAPTITTPANNATTGANPLIVYTAVEGVQNYEIWISRTVNGVVVQRVLYEQFATATTYTPLSPLSTGDYRVWVRAIGLMGQRTNWSTYVDFSIALSTPETDSGDGSTDSVFAALDVLPQSDVSQAAEFSNRTAESAAGSDDQQLPIDSGASQFVVTVGDHTRAAEPGRVLRDSPVPAKVPAVESDSADHPAERVLDAVLTGWHHEDWWQAAEEVL